MKYIWRTLRGRERLSHVFWPGFGVMFIYSFLMRMLNSPFDHVPAIVWKVLNYTATAFAIWFIVSLWMCAYGSKWRVLGHLIRAGIVLYLAFLVWLARALGAFG